MKKILLVSLNSGDVFIGELASRLVTHEFDVWRYFVLDGKLHHYNTARDISLFEPPENGSLSLMRMIQNSLKVNRYIKKVDYIHYHYIDAIIGILFYFLFPLSRKRTLATFWGSDYYKSTKKTSRIRKRLLRKANTITFTNPITQDTFNKQYPQWASKTSTVRFGLIPLDDIAELTPEDGWKMRRQLNLPLNKRIVCVGTNASANQNHEAIIKALMFVDPSILDELHFLIPLGYPSHQEAYINKISAKIPEELRTLFTLDRSFHSGKNLAAYRACIDILIQTQTTDQFSGAMQEVMASGGDVITGTWLPYEVLKKRKVHYFEIESFEELPSALETVCKEPITREQATHNTSVIRSLSHWEEVIIEWVNLYS